MQRFRSIVGAFTIALVGPLIFASVVRAEDFPFKAAGSSRVLFDASNPPEVVFFEVTTQGRGALGQFVADSFVVLVPGNPADCEEGEVSLTIADIQITSTYKDFSQILEQGTGFQCANPLTGAIRGFGSGIVFGGTGRFAGRMGTFEATFSGQSFDIMNRVALEGTITFD